MKRYNLPDTDYLEITKAASILGCDVADIIHWAANQKTTLFLMLKEAECAVIIRNLTQENPNDSFDKQMEYQDRLVSSTLKITQGEFGLAQLSFNDVRPKKQFGDVPMFYRFSYGGVTFPLTMMAKASGLWALGHSFAKQLESHGVVEFRSFFVAHGYLLTIDRPIDNFQVSIVPVTSAKNPDVPNCRVLPEHLWLTNESMQRLLGSTASHSANPSSPPLKKPQRYSPKKHAMLCFLAELLMERDDALATIAFERNHLTPSNYQQLVTELSHALQCPAEELIRQLLSRCVHYSVAFLFLGNKQFEEWSNTAIAEAIQTLMSSRERDQIQCQLANIDKNTIQNWLN
ncbi:hypothetical protein [Aeromonas sp. sif2416]|uniref:hypothetical protein n=1 Tax=Aeromonas sp. sif2416 TaxID=2854793 RepID=UPI001C458637|nr:hypothetical protein [Aeromonas sp. sif2416]MBV7437098.1 hypothetical protein [Aeromonas sp. sif2416]